MGDGVTFTDIIAAEQEFFNYRINNLLWKDLADASGENIDWMASHGVKFSGVVDDYHGLGKFDCFHWFEEGSGSNYIDPMLESAQKLGAVVMADTPALDLVVENGAVKGLYAEKPDGSILQVNAKAVILTSGGYAQNEETMAERGWDLTYSHNNGVNGHDGDGLRMATSAGAHDVSRERCFLREAYSFGIDFFADMSQTIHRGGPVLWVNQDAERYTNEGCGSFVPQCVGNAVHTQAESYLVMSKDVIDEFVSRTGYEGLQADMDEAAAQCPGDNVYKADTIKELAEASRIGRGRFRGHRETVQRTVRQGRGRRLQQGCGGTGAHQDRTVLHLPPRHGVLDLHRGYRHESQDGSRHGEGRAYSGPVRCRHRRLQPLSRNVHDEHSGLVQRQQLQFRPHRSAQRLRGVRQVGGQSGNQEQRRRPTAQIAVPSSTGTVARHGNLARPSRTPTPISFVLKRLLANKATVNAAG